MYTLEDMKTFVSIRELRVRFTLGVTLEHRLTRTCVGKTSDVDSYDYYGQLIRRLSFRDMRY